MVKIRARDCFHQGVFAQRSMLSLLYSQSSDVSERVPEDWEMVSIMGEAYVRQGETVAVVNHQTTNSHILPLCFILVGSFTLC